MQKFPSLSGSLERWGSFKFCPVPNSRLLNLSRVFALGETDCCGSEPVLALDAEWGSIAFASSAGEIGNLYKPIIRIDDLVLANSSSEKPTTPIRA
jgi:hypothetical protein